MQRPGSTMDQLSAHLDRGWDLAQKGDANGAESSARRAVELCPDSPEAHNLLGYVAAMAGDCEEAVEAYQQAVFLDETYIEAMLNAAELMVTPLGDYEGAMRLCEQVLDATDFDDEIVDALLLMFEVHLGRGELEECARVLERLPAGPYESGGQSFLVGRAWFEAGNIDKAREAIAAALEDTPGHAEAHYYNGLIQEALGDSRRACVSFLTARNLELDAGPPPWAPDAETFMLFTQRAIEGLDGGLGRLFNGAELYLADVPGPEMVVDGVDLHAQVLVDAVLRDDAEGDAVPANDGQRTTEGAAPAVEDLSLRVFIYALNVMRAAGGLHDIQATLGEALQLELSATLQELSATNETPKRM